MDSQEEFPYQPFYCEENIWHLTRMERFRGKPCRVVFTSNENKTCGFRHSRAAGNSDDLVFWDYHVFFIVGEESWVIWDPDSTLPMPCEPEFYLPASFGTDLLAEFRPWFRVIDAPDYGRRFSSDRSHMLGEDGTHTRPLPLWPPIYDGTRSNLAEFVDMKAPSPGQLLTLEEFAAFLSKKPC